MFLDIWRPECRYGHATADDRGVLRKHGAPSRAFVHLAPTVTLLLQTAETRFGYGAVPAAATPIHAGYREG